MSSYYNVNHRSGHEKILHKKTLQKSNLYFDIDYFFYIIGKFYFGLK